MAASETHLMRAKLHLLFALPPEECFLKLRLLRTQELLLLELVIPVSHSLKHFFQSVTFNSQALFLLLQEVFHITTSLRRAKILSLTPQVIPERSSRNSCWKAESELLTLEWLILTEVTKTSFFTMIPSSLMTHSFSEWEFKIRL